MITESQNPSVPLFHSLAPEQRNNRDLALNNAGTTTGTTDLKLLAQRLLSRNNMRNTAATAPALAVPSRESVTEHPASHTTYAERAAVIEYEAGIPREWAEAFARVSCMTSPPKPITRAAWRRITDSVGVLLDDKPKLQQIIQCGWGVADIFGCHWSSPEINQSCKGLLLLLGDHEKIVSVDDKAIGTVRGGSSNTLYYMRPYAASAQIMIWDLISSGSEVDDFRT